MATSGSKTVVIYSAWLDLKFSWWQTGQSVEDNSTTIDWKMELISGNGALYVYSKAWEVTIDGVTKSGRTDIDLDENSTATLASGTAVIPHNDDGTKTFTYSFSQSFYLTLDNGSYMTKYSGSGSDTLTTIARASQPSCITWPEHTQNVGYFGDEISIHMNRKSSTFTHTVRYQFGSQSGTISTGVGTGTTWVIPETLMDLIPAATSGSGTIYVDTYNGTTKIGTKSCGFTAKVPASVIPRCTVQVLDDTDIQATYGNLVKGLSKLYVKVNGYTAYSSPITAYSVTANGVKYTKNEFVTGVLTASGTTTITATVTDKRGRTSEQASASFPVIDYTPPVVTDLTVHRCDADGTPNDQGEYVEILFSAIVSPLNDLNSASYSVKYKETSSESWTTLTEDVNGWKPADLEGNYNVNNQSLIIAADGNSSYDVEVTVTDDQNTTIRSTSASTAFTLMNWNSAGNGMGIGRVAEKENTLQIGMDVEFFGNLTGTIFNAILPVGSIVIRFDHTNPGDLYPGTTWVRMENTFLWGCDESGDIGITGGEKTVTLTEEQLPAHNHGGTYTNAGTATKTHAWLTADGSSMAYEAVDTGGGEPHNNMPPYTQVSIWRRTE